MNVEIGTETPIFLFWEYLFRNFGILSLQCISADEYYKQRMNRINRINYSMVFYKSLKWAGIPYRIKKPILLPSSCCLSACCMCVCQFRYNLHPPPPPTPPPLQHHSQHLDKNTRGSQIQYPWRPLSYLRNQIFEHPAFQLDIPERFVP
jgi:hypothetical protein